MGVLWRNPRSPRRLTERLECTGTDRDKGDKRNRQTQHVCNTLCRSLGIRCILTTSLIILFIASWGRDTRDGDTSEALKPTYWEMPPSMSRDWGGATITFVDLPDEESEESGSDNYYMTSDHWPEFSRERFPGPLPVSPYRRRFAIQWNFNTSAFLQRSDVKSSPPKLITWMTKSRHVPPLPEPVRLRLCPEMPCRLTSNRMFSEVSAALLWNGFLTHPKEPPIRSHQDQVYVFHNNEPQTPDWFPFIDFRSPGWSNNVNWTWSYRNDADLKAYYGYIVRRPIPKVKNYTDILSKKTGVAAWMSSNCKTFGGRERYVKRLQKYGVHVDVYGACGKTSCPRSHDEECIEAIGQNYKFLLAFESAFCTDYLSEKFFRYLDADLVVVSRASNQHKDHAPPGTFINTNDFSSPKALAEYLKHLSDEEYIQILKNKDQYQALYEDWPLRDKKGNVTFMQYHFEALGYCEMCRRLWDLDTYGKYVPNFEQWLDKGNCYPPGDLHFPPER